MDHKGSAMTDKMQTDRRESPRVGHPARRRLTDNSPAELLARPKPRIPVVEPSPFLLATRDAGYRNAPAAIAEFVDNALQAGAENISIRLMPPSGDCDHPEVLVIDDGAGMSVDALHHALTFGGSSRFNDRHSLGRYGMGLPNGALSIARRVDVYTWQGDAVHACTLDIDDFIEGRRRTLGRVERVRRPEFVPSTSSGTAIYLSKCDQIGYKRRGFLRRRLVEEIGRMFRYFLTSGVKIGIDNEGVAPVDPLFLMPEAALSGAQPFGDILTYEVRGATESGGVRVRFSELPVEEWYRASNKEKRQQGITNSETVSIVRAGREIDAGWWFMGDKRRENYDDWWRCEVSFDPHLDELFGVTHTKQGIRPTPELLALLAQDLEPIARALNRRVRDRFEAAKQGEALSRAEDRAARASAALPPLPDRCDEFPGGLRPVPYSDDGKDSGVRYRIRAAELNGTSAYEAVLREGNVLVLLNNRHPLYRDLYAPLADLDDEAHKDLAERLALLLLSLGHAELATSSAYERTVVQQFRQRWDDVIATFFND